MFLIIMYLFLEIDILFINTMFNQKCMLTKKIKLVYIIINYCNMFNLFFFIIYFRNLTFLFTIMQCKRKQI